MINPHAYPAGALILFTCGEYSDYGHHGLCRTTAPVDLPALAERYRAEVEPDAWLKEMNYGPDPEGFVPWLITLGLLDPVDHSTCHTHSYSSWSAVFRPKDEQ